MYLASWRNLIAAEVFWFYPIMQFQLIFSHPGVNTVHCSLNPGSALDHFWYKRAWYTELFHAWEIKIHCSWLGLFSHMLIDSTLGWLSLDYSQTFQQCAPVVTRHPTVAKLAGTDHHSALTQYNKNPLRPTTSQLYTTITTSHAPNWTSTLENLASHPGPLPLHKK